MYVLFHVIKQTSRSVQNIHFTAIAIQQGSGQAVCIKLFLFSDIYCSVIDAPHVPDANSPFARVDDENSWL